jgi:hypothetical protein
MAIYIDLEDLKILFGSTYRHSTLRGDEWIRILEIRYGQQDQKSSSYARNSKGSGLLQDGLPED